MTTTDSPREDLRYALLVCVAVSFAAFVLAVAGLDRFGDALLRGLRPIDGEIKLAHAEDLRAAGYDSEALSAYEAALGSPFWGPQNRAFALKQLGALLVRLGQFEAAVPRFEESVATGRAPISVYKDYLQALQQLGRTEEMQVLAERWLEAAEAEQHAIETARAHAVLGRLALNAGDPAEAERHYAAGQAAFPGGENALALARMAAARGDAASARALLKQVFSGGAEENLGEEAQQLWEQLG